MMHGIVRRSSISVLVQRQPSLYLASQNRDPKHLPLQRCFRNALSSSATTPRGQSSNAGASSFDDLWNSSAVPQESDQAEAVYRTRVPSKIAPVPRPHPAVWGSISGPLTTTQLQSYDKHGFLQVDQLLNENEVVSLRQDFDLLISDPNIRSNPRCVIEKSSDEVRSIFEVHKLSSALRRLLMSGKLTKIARQILGSDVYIHQSRINFKPAFHGAGFFWHSDFETWHAEDGMPVPRALSFSISLTDNSLANGPLMIIPGSHKTFVSCIGDTPENHHLQSLRQQEIGVADKESLSMLVDQGNGIEVFTGWTGSAVLFDSNCMYGSSDNITPQTRCNLFIVFNSVENTVRDPYYANKRRPDYIAATDFTTV